jgi:serine protease Do
MMRNGIFSRSAWTKLAAGGIVVGLLAAGLGVAQDDDDASPTGFAGPPSFADVIEDVSPAVVNIAVTMQPVRVSSDKTSPFAGAPFGGLLERFGVPGQQWGVPDMRPRQGEGSGFIIDSEGYIATNYHVVNGASEVTVTLNSGEELPATVVGRDSATDLALLKIENGRDLPALEFGDSDRARVGDWVLAIGNPFGLGGSATAGIISARGRDIQSGRYDDFIQVDAAINSGNSGGPVFNAAGEVIGINTAIISPNGGNVGIGMAIPSNQATAVLDELRERGAVSRGWLGVSISPLEAAGDIALPANVTAGALVANVVADSPAARAGLARGDIVTQLDGLAIDGPRTLSRLVGDLDAGDEVEIEYLRDGQPYETSIVLGELADAEMRAAVEPVDPRSRQPQRYFRYQWPEAPFRR